MDPTQPSNEPTEVVIVIININDRRNQIVTWNDWSKNKFERNDLSRPGGYIVKKFQSRQTSLPWNTEIMYSDLFNLSHDLRQPIEMLYFR